MSDLTFNKIAGAVLATALAVVGLEELSAIVFQSQPVAKPGYAIEVAADTGGPAAPPELPPDWGTVLPTADVGAGKTATAVCQTCHNFAKDGPNLVGPNLYGVVGRKPGSHPGFAYSPGMTAEGGKLGTWTYEELNDFLKGPQAYVQGTKMTFVGLKKQDSRINVIAYLRSLSDSPVAIPAPAPKVAAGPAPAASDAAPNGPSTAPTGPVKPLAPGAATAASQTTPAATAAAPVSPGSAPKP